MTDNITTNNITTNNITRNIFLTNNSLTNDSLTNNSLTNNIELVAPAGDLEKLKTAITFGANAVYCGGAEFSLRSAGKNLTTSEMSEGIEFAHSHGAQVYIALNVFARNNDIKKLPDVVEEYAKIGADAFIVSDPGVFSLCREIAPNIPIHISTQANVTNWLSAKFWHEMGAERVVLARELNLKEIAEISSRVKGLKLEAFVHGAMCMSFSGRCLLSAALTKRSANAGLCAHPCRYQYALVEEQRPGEYYPIHEDERGTYILNANDMSLISYLPQVLAAGVSALKIEGRMKTIHYVASAVYAYRHALDDILFGGFAPEKHISKKQISEKQISESQTLEREISVSQISESQTSGKQTSERQTSESQMSESQMSERQISEREISEREISERKISEREISEREISERDISEREISESQISEKQTSSEQSSEKQTPEGLAKADEHIFYEPISSKPVSSAPACDARRLRDGESIYRENLPSYKQELDKISHRPYGTGFYFDEPKQTGDSSQYTREYQFLGIVRSCEDGFAIVEQRGKFSVGDVVEILTPKGCFEQAISRMWDEQGNCINNAIHPKQSIRIETEHNLSPFDIMRKPC